MSPELLEFIKNLWITRIIEEISTFWVEPNIMDILSEIPHKGLNSKFQFGFN